MIECNPALLDLILGALQDAGHYEWAICWDWIVRGPHKPGEQGPCPGPRQIQGMWQFAADAAGMSVDDIQKAVLACTNGGQWQDIEAPGALHDIGQSIVEGAQDAAEAIGEAVGDAVGGVMSGAGRGLADRLGLPMWALALGAVLVIGAGLAVYEGLK